MSVYNLFYAYKKWKEHKCFTTFVGLYNNGFYHKSIWNAPWRLYRVVKNLITGKYERFCEYYSKDYN